MIFDKSENRFHCKNRTLRWHFPQQTSIVGYKHNILICAGILNISLFRSDNILNSRELGGETNAGGSTLVNFEDASLACWVWCSCLLLLLFLRGGGVFSPVSRQNLINWESNGINAGNQVRIRCRFRKMSPHFADNLVLQTIYSAVVRRGVEIRSKFAHRS